MQNKKQTSDSRKAISPNTNDSRNELKENLSGNITDPGKHTLDATDNNSPAVIQDESEQPDHHFKEVVLSKEQILCIQDELFDFFHCEPLEDWKWDMQTFFTGWVGSKMSEEMDPVDRSERVFSYHIIIKFMEKLAPFFEPIHRAVKHQYSSK